MSSAPREKFPKYVIPVFMLWVALCNIVSIIISVIWLNLSPIGYGIVIGINALSILLLYPLFKMDPIKPFFVPAMIWYGVVTIAYIIIAILLSHQIFWFLIPGTIQLFADIWFQWHLSRISNS